MSFDQSGPRPRGGSDVGPRRGPREGGLTLTLDAAVRSELSQAAAAAGVRPWELATRWLIERLRDDAVGGEREEMWGEIDSITDRLDRLERTVAALPARRERTGAPRQLPLHLAIARTLHEAGGTLSVDAIAERLRASNAFRGPRSGRPPTTSMISSRVAHEAYRRAFRREGSQVSLVVPFESLAAGKTLRGEEANGTGASEQAR